MHFISNELTIKGTTKIRFHRQRQLYIRSAKDEPKRLRIPLNALTFCIFTAPIKITRFFQDQASETGTDLSDEETANSGHRSKERAGPHLS